MEAFVSIPFHHPFNDEVYSAIQDAAIRAVPDRSLRCASLAEIKAAGKISDDLIERIREADICIADITGPSANVMWEVGYIAALQKPTIILTQAIGAVPFNIKDLRVIAYSIDRLDETLIGPLSTTIQETLTRYAIRRQNRVGQLPAKTTKAIAITGSYSAPAERVQRRIETLTAPYLARDVTWYCGTTGISDETAAQYLLERKERVAGVGFNSSDITPRMLQILEQFGAPMIDASQEQMPPVQQAPTDRDVFFSTRADLVVLIWDGKSPGIARVREWLLYQKKDHLVGYV